MTLKIFRWFLLACLLLTPPTPAHAQTAYEAIGGRDALVRIVDRLFEIMLADARVNEKLDNINIDRLKHRIVEHVCELSGGPCRFKGISMPGSHAYLELTEQHFNATVEDLEQAMDDNAIPFSAQKRLLAVLAPLERQIVTK